jgi:hypothetical protein
MSKPNALTPEQLERQQARQKRKAFWDKIWTYVILALAAAFVLWRIITVISHHL